MSEPKRLSKRKQKTPLPTEDQILEFIRESKGPVGKREVARAFNVRGPAKIALKAVMKRLQVGSDVTKSKRRFQNVGALLPVDVIEISATDNDGDLFAKPVNWSSEAPPPAILVLGKPERGKAYGIGDRLLARLSPAGDNAYEARVMKRMPTGAGKLMGVFELLPGGFARLRPTDRRYRHEVTIAAKDANGAEHGDLVTAEIIQTRHHGPQHARVVERFGKMDRVKNLSLIAINAQGIPHEFPDAAEKQARDAVAAPLGDRTDLRNIPLVTIDGEDARDFDDAVWAEPDTDPENPGGWHTLVAIADVSWYVRPGDALDQEAFKRGNSTYFPDRVVPMLPEELSNGWCSLKPKEDRPCMAVHMYIDAHGKLLRHKFVRGLMRSVARLTYNQVQAAIDGHPDDLTSSLVESILKPLYGAFHALLEARNKRGTLELDLTERQILVDRTEGHITGVVPRARYDSHKLIEEFMIMANVAAAERLEGSGYPCVYRVHEPPDPERLENLREALRSLELPVPTGSARPGDFNRILSKVRGGPHEHLANTLVLRTQSQAVYSHNNLGHFGLALKRYAHFTSPIRRYSDLLVHRALIAAGKLGEGGWDPTKDPDLDEITEHISFTERRSATAERETVDRFTAAYLGNKIDAMFNGRVNGVTRFGAFITLDETGADGILPMRNLPRDYYDLDEASHRLIGQRHGLVLRVGDPVVVRLLETDDITGSIVFAYVEGASQGRGENSKHHRQGKHRQGHHRQGERGRPKNVRLGKSKRSKQKRG
ncbi:MAG: ribonuclease R [Rhodospirillaceae bacterium]|nr:ribonuclease R [Rhodospirillaceae bacterium]